MVMVGLALWACSLIGVTCDASTPDVAIIQSAYEQEASNGSKLHDRGLRVLEASCERGTAADMPKADWRHPYYWAAFIPSGAWTTLDGKEPK